MTGQIYPVGVIPENSVIRNNNAAPKSSFLIFKKRGFHAGYWNEKIIAIGGLLFYDRNEHEIT
jgi:hypothetical protein